MDITYFGHSSFLIKTRDCKIVTDPFDPKVVGFPFPKPTADIVTVSHPHGDHNNVVAVQGEPMVFDWPGEFERKGVRIFGVQSYHDDKEGAERGENVIFKFELEGMTVVHAGDQGFVADNKQMEEIGDVDILIVPVGGHYTIDAKQAADMAKKIEPHIIIPMHYAHDRLNPELASHMAPVDEFIKQMNVEAPQPVDKLSVKKEDLAEKELAVVLLSF